MGVVNGHKATIVAFLSGVGIVLFGYFISALVSVGSERQKVLGYIERTEPLDIASTAHRADGQAHVTASEKAMLATIGLELRDIHEELRKINVRMENERRAAR